MASVTRSKRGWFLNLAVVCGYIVLAFFAAGVTVEVYRVGFSWRIIGRAFILAIPIILIIRELLKDDD